MKKMLSLFLAAMMLFLVSCSASNTGTEKKEKEKPKNQAVSVDKGLLSVTVTIPSSMFENENVDEAVANAKKEGIDATKNADGSVTYKMSKAKHREMMKEMKASVIKAIDDTKSGKDFKSVKDITYNDDFSEFTLVVDKAAYDNSMDGFAALTLGMSGMMYQLYNGVKPDEYNVTVSIKDQATQQVFDTIKYPDALKNTKQ